MDIKGSVVVITGGGTGIGAAVAKSLAAAGAKVALAGRRIERLEQTVAEIKADGGEAIAVQTDVTKEEDLAHLMDKAIETFGSLNVVLANAGRFADSLMINTDKATGKVKSVMSTDQFRRWWTPISLEPFSPCARRRGEWPTTAGKACF